MRHILVILACLLFLPAHAQHRTAKSDGFKGKVKKVVSTYLIGRSGHNSVTVTETWYSTTGLAQRSLVHHFVLADNDTVGRSGEELYFEAGRLHKHVHHNADSGRRRLTTTDVYRYDRKGRKILHTQQDIRKMSYLQYVPDTVMQRSEFFYDSNNREVLEYLFEGYGEDPLEKKQMYVTSYSDDGKRQYVYCYAYEYDGIGSFNSSTIRHTDSNKVVTKWYSADHKLWLTQTATTLEDGRMHLTETIDEYHRYDIPYTFGPSDVHGNRLWFTRDTKEEIVKQSYSYTYYK